MRHLRLEHDPSPSNSINVHNLCEFQDGTLNYALLPAVTTGLHLLSAYLPTLPTHLAALSASCTCHLENLRWSRSGAHAIHILSRVPGMPPEPGEAMQGVDGIISCLMLNVSASYNANGVHNTNANPDRLTGTRQPYTPVACRHSRCFQWHSFTHWLHVQPGRCSSVTLTWQSHDHAWTQW
jgi:hypothetical protein